LFLAFVAELLLGPCAVYSTHWKSFWPAPNFLFSPYFTHQLGVPILLEEPVSPFGFSPLYNNFSFGHAVPLPPSSHHFFRGSLRRTSISGGPRVNNYVPCWTANVAVLHPTDGTFEGTFSASFLPFSMHPFFTPPNYFFCSPSQPLGCPPQNGKYSPNLMLP